jgi:hypothetical protein
MPLQQNSKWVNESGCHTSYREGETGILELQANKIFSQGHGLRLHISKITSHREGISSKLLPLIVAMWEKKGDSQFNDFYSFDSHGDCLSHGYSRSEMGKAIVDEEHDRDVARLIEHGKTIQELIGDYPTEGRFETNPTVIDLKENMLRNKYPINRD